MARKLKRSISDEAKAANAIVAILHGFAKEARTAIWKYVNLPRRKGDRYSWPKR